MSLNGRITTHHCRKLCASQPHHKRITAHHCEKTTHPSWKARRPPVALVAVARRPRTHRQGRKAAGPRLHPCTTSTILGALRHCALRAPCVVRAKRSGTGEGNGNKRKEAGEKERREVIAGGASGRPGYTTGHVVFSAACRRLPSNVASQGPLRTERETKGDGLQNGAGRDVGHRASRVAIGPSVAILSLLSRSVTRCSHRPPPPLLQTVICLPPRDGEARSEPHRRAARRCSHCRSAAQI